MRHSIARKCIGYTGPGQKASAHHPSHVTFIEMFAHPMSRLILTIQPNDLNDAHLQQLIQPGNLLINAQYPLISLRHGTMCQKHKRVPLARCVRLGRQESPHEFWSIGYEVFELAVDGVYCKDGVFATYEWRCSRQERQSGMSGSRSSASLEIFWRKRKVAPRIYSLGCC